MPDRPGRRAYERVCELAAERQVTPTLQQVKDAIPYGVMRWKETDTFDAGEWRTIPSAYFEPDDEVETLTPEQVHERIINCEGCGGSGKTFGSNPTFNPQYGLERKYLCPVCSPYRRLVEK